MPYKNLRNLKYHIGFIDEDILNTFGGFLTTNGSRLEQLELTINKDNLDQGIKFKNVYSSISSDEYK